MSDPRDEDGGDDFQQRNRAAWTVRFRLPISVVATIITLIAIMQIDGGGHVVLGVVILSSVLIALAVYVLLHRRGY